MLWWNSLKGKGVSETAVKHFVHCSLCFFFCHIANTQYRFGGTLTNTHLHVFHLLIQSMPVFTQTHTHTILFPLSLSHTGPVMKCRTHWSSNDTQNTPHWSSMTNSVCILLLDQCVLHVIIGPVCSACH